MNEDQLKFRVLVFQTLDWILFLSVLSFGIYAFFYAENRLLMSLIAVLGLLLVDWIGKFTFDKTAVLRVDLNMLQKRQRGPGI